MNKTNYKQYDTRWAKLPYPKKPWYIDECGCGEVAICNSIIEMSKYKKDTPKTIQPYCKQYAASNGDGTEWDAIPIMMKHYGMKNVKEHATMASLWKELAKGNCVAVYLMSNILGGSNGVKWTGSKHFVCSTGYKCENGKHLVYVKDSNSSSSLRNGWVSYEGNMRNAVYKVWSGELPAVKTSYKPTTPYKGKLPTKTLKKGDKGTQVKYMKDFLAWRYNYKWENNTFGTTAEKRVKHFQKNYAKKYGLAVDGVFGKASRKAAKKIVKAYADKYAPKVDPLQPWLDAMVTQFNWSKDQKYEFDDYPTVANSKKKGTCITFPSVSLQRIGLLPVGGYIYYYPKYKKLYGNKIGRDYVANHPEIFSVSYPNKTIAELGSNIKKGDIIGFGDPAYHTMVYMGKNADGQPIFNTMGHKKGLMVTYPEYANRKVNMIVRLKKLSK